MAPPRSRPLIRLGFFCFLLTICQAFTTLPPASRRWVAKLGTRRSGVEETKGVSRAFDDLVAYPCTFQVKVIGANEGTFVTDVLGLVGGVTGVAPKKLPFKVRVTASEKYVSVSVDAPVADAAMLRDVYGAIDGDPRIKFVL
jgi:putative lipoic acid-binding regulatory protein